MNNPLVTIVCLCYNQKGYVTQTLDSVQQQSYTNLQVIVIDNGSTDGSHEEITAYCARPSWKFEPPVLLGSNLGNCRGFNIGLDQAKGKYIIDLSCDDVLTSDRIERQVAFFEDCPQDTGMIYSNATYIDDTGRRLYNHFSPQTNWIPHSGDIYRKVIASYFIPTPTMMFKTEVLNALGGYDEELAYEDFDIWVRIAREYPCFFQNEVLMLARKTTGSMSSTWYHKGDQQAYSTHLVCRKIKSMNHTAEEDEALVRRLLFELRQCFKSRLSKEYNLNYELLRSIRRPPLVYRIMRQFI